MAHELLGALDRGAGGGLLGAGHSWVAPPTYTPAAPTLPVSTRVCCITVPTPLPALHMRCKESWKGNGREG